MDLQERLKELLNEKGAKPAHLAAAVGATRAAVSDWVNGNTKKISPDYLFATADYFGVRVEWLSFGAGEKYTVPTGETNKNGGKVFAPSGMGERNAEQGADVSIQSYEVWSGIVVKEIRTMSVPGEWLAEANAQIENVVNIEMPDDSQSPAIRKGYRVAINTEWGGLLKNDTVYAVKIGGQYTLRRAMIKHDDDVLLRCENSNAFPDDLVLKKSISSLDVLGVYVSFQGR